MCMRFSRSERGDEGNQFHRENNGLYLCTGLFVFLCDLQDVERHSDDDQSRVTYVEALTFQTFSFAGYLNIALLNSSRTTVLISI